MRKICIRSASLRHVLIFLLSTGFFGTALNAQPLVLYGAIDNHLVTVNTSTGQATSVGTFSAALSPLGNLTYHPGTGQLLALANVTTNPTLVSLDRNTGAATIIAPVVLTPPGRASELAEGLAYNPADGLLYGSLDTIAPPSNFFSRRLVTIDPATGVATKVADISGTCQAEADAMAWGNGTLYITDGCPNPNILYTANATTGAATQIGVTGVLGIGDMTFDPNSGQLYGYNSNRELHIFNLSNGTVNAVGPTHTAADFNGQFMRGLSFAPDPNSNQVPTLSQWGLILLGLTVLCLGAIRMFNMRNRLASEA